MVRHKIKFILSYVMKKDDPRHIWRSFVLFKEKRSPNIKIALGCTLQKRWVANSQRCSISNTCEGAMGCYGLIWRVLGKINNIEITFYCRLRKSWVKNMKTSAQRWTPPINVTWTTPIRRIWPKSLSWGSRPNGPCTRVSWPSCLVSCAPSSPARWETDTDVAYSS